MSVATRDQWSIKDSEQLYEIDRWGDDYFQISPDGNLLVSPERDGNDKIDLTELVDRLKHRGLDLPILLRFNGILRDRLKQIHDAFQIAIDDHKYTNDYRCIYPVKVNQQRDVVKQVIEYGQEYGFGLEAGSKPELLAVVAMTDRRTPIICNGFKDEQFIRLALMAQRLGRTVIPVVEKVSELDRILETSDQLGVRPTIGMRVKLAARGSGRWKDSGGHRSKFGLTVAEMLLQFERLVERDMADCFQLLHFHVGSQIGNIRRLKTAIVEASRVYVEFHRRGAGLQYLDVGGGLAVDYNGTRSDTDSSMNYTLQEYANNVVFHVQTVCDKAGVPHPQLMSESGRAVAAHHSVLIVEAVGTTSQESASSIPSEVSRTEPQPLQDLWIAYQNIRVHTMRESLHDAQVSFDLIMSLFTGGSLTLEQRVGAENLYFAILHRVRELAASVQDGSKYFRNLDYTLSDICFTNFSLFQSAPDAWAIDQLFPVIPLHRLNEKPTRHAVLSDVTCDSMGTIDHYVCRQGDGRTLLIHPTRPGDRYYLGVFLVGAYQEILGGLHNLFGDTHAVHIDFEDGAAKVHSIVKGDTVSDVLGYVQYQKRELVQKLEETAEDAIQGGWIDHRQAGETVAFYEKALSEYTYLTE